MAKNDSISRLFLMIGPWLISWLGAISPTVAADFQLTDTNLRQAGTATIVDTSLVYTDFIDWTISPVGAGTTYTNGDTVYQNGAGQWIIYVESTVSGSSMSATDGIDLYLDRRHDADLATLLTKAWTANLLVENVPYPDLPQNGSTRLGAYLQIVDNDLPFSSFAGEWVQFKWVLEIDSTGSTEVAWATSAYVRLATGTPPPVATHTPTPTPTSTATPTPTFTPTPTPTVTDTPTPGPSPTPTNTPSFTPTATFTPVPTATQTSTPAPTLGIGFIQRQGNRLLFEPLLRYDTIKSASGFYKDFIIRIGDVTEALYVRSHQARVIYVVTP